MTKSININKIYFSKKDFLENYNILSKEYIGQHIDYEHNDFIKFEISLYKNALELLELIINPSNFDQLPSFVDLNLFWDLMIFFEIPDHGVESFRDFSYCHMNGNFKFSADIFFKKKYTDLIISWNKIIKLLEDGYEELEKNLMANPRKKNVNYSLPQGIDPNKFNIAGYNLFTYLIENYTAKKEKIIKYINIYYYMKYEIHKDEKLSKIYTFSFIQEDYKEFIQENYSVEIRKFAKAVFDFDEQIRVLNSLESNFRRQFFEN